MKVYIVTSRNGDQEVLDAEPRWDWKTLGQTVRVANVNGGDSVALTLTLDERTRIANGLAGYAEGVAENLADDPDSAYVDDQAPVVEDYLADADRILAGEQPVHELTREVLLDELGPAMLDDDPAGYLELARLV